MSRHLKKARAQGLKGKKAMSLEANCRRKMDKFARCAIRTQHATFGEDPSNTWRNHCQQTDLKALIANGSAYCNQTRQPWRNNPRKTRATFTCKTAPKVARVAEGFQAVTRRLHEASEKSELRRCRKPTRFRHFHHGRNSVSLSFRPIADSGEHQAANEPHPSPSAGGLAVIDRQRAFLKRDPLVSEEDLHLIQTHLLRHLTDCQDCCIEGHLYCHQAERTGSGYAAYLTEIPDAEQRHADHVPVVIQARIPGITGGIHGAGCTGPTRGGKQAGNGRQAVYGIDADRLNWRS